jgi:hypothetical protein
MPERRLAAARGTLPAGYQFGDAAGGPGSIRMVWDELQGQIVSVAFPIDGRPHAASVLCPTCGVSTVERGSSCPACHCGVL